MVLPDNLSIQEKVALAIFALAALLNLWGNFIALDGLIIVSKPILMLSLIGYFSLGSNPSRAYYYFVLGMILCMGGDIFLMFNTSGSDGYFLAGLSSFLLGHLAYYASFKRLLTEHVDESTQSKNFILPGILVFTIIIFLSQLIPYVESAMRLPVTAYAMVITLMMIGASKINTHFNNKISLWLLIGALVFAFSDCILSMSLFRFESSAPGFRIGIMSTYILAQFLLATQFKRLLKIKTINI